MKSKRSKLLDRLFEDGAVACANGKPCEFPGTRSLERAAWENGWRWAKKEIEHAYDRYAK